MVPSVLLNGTGCRSVSSLFHLPRPIFAGRVAVNTSLAETFWRDYVPQSDNTFKILVNCRNQPELCMNGELRSSSPQDTSYSLESERVGLIGLNPL